MRQSENVDWLAQNLLFGMISLQRGLISKDQLGIALQTWLVSPASKATATLSDILVDQGHLTELDQQGVSEDLNRLTKTHCDCQTALLEVINPASLRILEKINQPGFQDALTKLIPPQPNSPTRYTTVSELAEGGLGKVLVARDNSLNRNVAFKEIKPQWVTNEQCQSLFLKEAQITGQLEHPNIVPIYELVHRGADNHPFYTMKLIEGKTLKDAIANYHKQNQSDPIEFQRLLNAFVSICHAIAYAHSSAKKTDQRHHSASSGRSA